MEYLTVIIFGFSFGAAGFLVAAVLTFPGEVLDWWPGLVQWITRTRGKSPVDYNKFQFIISKITYICPKCIAGQLAFWFSVFSLSIGQGFICVTLSIFFAFAIEKKYE